MLTKLGSAWGSVSTSGWTLVLIILALGITQILPNAFEIRYPKTKRAAIAAAVVLIACLIFLNYKQAAFLYYQF